MAKEFPKGRTAFLVIHGIGEQNPLETLDSFSRGFIGLFNELKIAFDPFHQITERKEAGGSSWTESFVRLKPKQGDGHIDIHEYYWAYLTEEKITVPEVWAWVEKALEGTRKFYDENEELRKRFEKDGKVSFRLAEVLKLLFWLSIFYPFLKIALSISLLLSRIPGISVFKKAAGFLQEKLRPMIVGYIGDVAIYTTTDTKSRFFELRRKILKESQALVESLLSDDSYDRVIIAGHSLGSVIAYDTLNRLNLAANLPDARHPALEKVGGLITFGSPLDKIAFFFREHAKKGEYVRRQIIQQLHSFKARQLSFEPNSIEMGCKIKPKLDGIPWVNYFDMNDPVSGHLDFYIMGDNDNVELRMDEKWGVAHTTYWGHQRMYGDIFKRFF